jgi:hypothetical protein
MRRDACNPGTGCLVFDEEAEMAVDSVGGPPPQTLAAPGDDAALAEAQAAFGQAVGTVIFSAAMNVVGNLSEHLAELEREE